ncbi:rna-directed dna polymerase from mobile element jockey-like [Pitangus sulphuratus]|nr:rna-directed dna polymerase from mobile element jockey-like [Pitangus sulphuratus]
MGKNKDPGNYWPVSLTSIPEKVMEHLIPWAIQDDKKVIRSSQCEFAKGKPRKCGLDELTVKWIKNDRSQTVVISGTGCNWRPVTNGIPQSSILGSVLFNLLISNVDEGVESLLSKFADDTKPRRVVNTPECCAALQKDLKRLEG